MVKGAIPKVKLRKTADKRDFDGTFAAADAGFSLEHPPTQGLIGKTKFVHVVADATFCLEDALAQGLIDEAKFADIDLGPTDALDEDTLAKQLDSYFGFGESPLTSPASSQPPSRPTSRPSTPPPSTSAPAQTSPCSELPSSSDSDSPSHPFSGNSNTRKRKRKAQARRKILRKQMSKDKPVAPTQYIVRPTTVFKHIHRASDTHTEFNLLQAPVASTGFIALPDGRGKVCTLKHLIDDLGFRYIRAEGSKSRAITDINGKVVAIYAGPPDKSDWSDVCKSAFEALQESASRCNFSKKSRKHRRGNFCVLNAGISYGGGQQAPGNLCHTQVNAKELGDLLKHPSFVRISGHATGVFATWAPNLYNYYHQHFEALLESNPKLRRNFPNSVWAAVAFNFGPKTVTARHRDFANLPFGLCAITALGQFDHTRGGHIILWELKLVIELPPGSTILIPSAIVSHSNTPIQKGEKRSSFTQFSAGGLFRWVDHGFQKDKCYFEGMTDDEKAQVVTDNKERCKLGMSLFSTLDELRGM